MFYMDELVPVHESAMNLPLHKHIGFLQIFTEGADAVGSGILISPNLVLTSAHNIYNK
jgi:V8-like Glu-specific endopeptidase